MISARLCHTGGGPENPAPAEDGRPFWQRIQPSKDDIVTYSLAIGISFFIRECVSAMSELVERPDLPVADNIMTMQVDC